MNCCARLSFANHWLKHFKRGRCMVTSLFIIFFSVWRFQSEDNRSVYSLADVLVQLKRKDELKHLQAPTRMTKTIRLHSWALLACPLAQRVLGLFSASSEKNSWYTARSHAHQRARIRTISTDFSTRVDRCGSSDGALKGDYARWAISLFGVLFSKHILSLYSTTYKQYINNVYSTSI